MTNQSISCVVLGGGGHASVVIEAIFLSGIATPVAVLDRDETSWGQKILGIPICGDDNYLSQLVKEGVTSFLVGLGGISGNTPRRRLFEFGMEMELLPLTVIHPKSICSQFANIGLGSVLLAGSIINAQARLGRNVIVNTGCIIEHDCVIEDHVHIATGAKIAGSVTIRREAHIGVGATIRQGIKVGEGAIVGAGAVVVKDVEPGIVVTGVPAYPIGSQG